MIVEFETTAFLTPLGRGEMRGQSYYSAWHKFRLDVTPEQWERIRRKREELAERDNEQPKGRQRAFDRRIVKRYQI